MYRNKVSMSLLKKVCDGRRQKAVKVASAVIDDYYKRQIFSFIADNGLFKKEAASEIESLKKGFPEILENALGQLIDFEWFDHPKVEESINNQAFDFISKRLRSVFQRAVSKKLNNALGLTDVTISTKSNKPVGRLVVEGQVTIGKIITKFYNDVLDSKQKEKIEKDIEDSNVSRTEYLKSWFTQKYKYDTEPTKIAEQDQISLGGSKVDNEEIFYDLLKDFGVYINDNIESLARVLYNTETKGQEGTAEKFERGKSPFAVTVFSPVEERGKSLEVSRGYGRGGVRLDPAYEQMLDIHMEQDIPLTINYEGEEVVPGAEGSTRRVIKFTIPESHDSSRVFSMEMPEGVNVSKEEIKLNIIKKQQSGSSPITNEPQKEGYVVQLLTEEAKKRNKVLDRIGEEGIDPTKLNSLYTNMVSNFITNYVKPDSLGNFEEFLEKFKGSIFIGNQEISDREDLTEYAESKRNEIIKKISEKGFSLGKEVYDTYTEQKEEEEGKRQEVENLFGEDIAKALSLSEEQIDNRSKSYAHIISQQFPDLPEFVRNPQDLSSWSLTNALSVKPFIYDVVNHITDRALTAIKTKDPQKSIPWRTFETHLLTQEDITNSDKFKKLLGMKSYDSIIKNLYALSLYKSSIGELSEPSKKKDTAKNIVEKVYKGFGAATPDMAVKAQQFFKGILPKQIIEFFDNINEKIKNAILKQKNDPLVKYLLSQSRSKGLQEKVEEDINLVDSKSEEFEKALINREEDKAINMAEELRMGRDVKLLFRSKKDFSSDEKSLEKIQGIVDKYEDLLRSRLESKKVEKKKKETKGQGTPKYKTITMKEAMDLYYRILNFEFDNKTM